MHKKKAIVFSSVFYHSKIKVGSHHYAEALSKEGYEVLYISFPVSILHLFFFFKNDNLVRLINRFKYHEKVYLNSFIPFSIFPLLNVFPFNSLFLLKKWVLFSDMYLNKRVNNFLENVDLIWVESAYFIDTVKYLKKNNTKIKIYTRLSDNVFAFNNFPKNYGYLLNESFSLSDKIIVSAKSLTKLIDEKFTNKVFHLPNGINNNHLKSYSIEMPSEYLIDKNETKIIYIGALENWFDWEIILHILNKVSNISIYIIGPLNGNNIKIKHDNLFLLGTRSHDQIGKYLKNANIGIIPFKRNDLIDYVDPIKFYEYSFFNIPTVCTFWDEVSMFTETIFLAKDKYEFSEHINFLINEKSIKNTLNVDLTKRDWHQNLKRVI